MTMLCDRCGLPEEAHEGEKKTCPGRHRYSPATWRQPYRYQDTGHKLTLSIDNGCASPVLICDDATCSPMKCHCTGEYGDIEPKPDCATCVGTGYDPSYPCWLRHWFEEFGNEVLEWTSWFPPITKFPVTIEVYCDGEEMFWRPTTREDVPDAQAA